VRSRLAHPGIARSGLAAHFRAGAISRLGVLLDDVEHGALLTRQERGRDARPAERVWTAAEALTGA
jgi:hypothetical protein